VDLLGGPADEIVLAPPQSVLKTSSGKIRRAATRELYDRGLVGAGQHAPWVQVTRLAWRTALARLRQWLAGVGHGLYGVYVWSLLAVVTMAGFVASFLPGLDVRRAAARWLAHSLLRAAGIPITVEGVARLPQNRPFVLVANHSSYIDGIVLVAAIPRGFAFTAKAELRGQWPIRHLLGSVGTRFVERFDARQGMNDTRELAAVGGAGESLAFFPEGTFRRAPGVLSFRMGAFVVSAQTGMALVPVTLVGTRAVLQDRSWVPRRLPIRVVIGEPIQPQGKDWDEAMRLRTAARAVLLAGCGEPDAEAEQYKCME
jgi:1-acyl-sn-glycerol-3-phosphate acyltransferase